MVTAVALDAEHQLAPEGRLVITKMVMTNFKSYAGEQVVGDFHKVRLHHFLDLYATIL